MTRERLEPEIAGDVFEDADRVRGELAACLLACNVALRLPPGDYTADELAAAMTEAGPLRFRVTEGGDLTWDISPEAFDARSRELEAAWHPATPGVRPSAGVRPSVGVGAFVGYRRAHACAVAAGKVAAAMPRAERALAEQLRRAADSAALNLAEGNDLPPREAFPYVQRARASAQEVLAALALVAERCGRSAELAEAAGLAEETSRILFARLRTLRAERRRPR